MYHINVFFVIYESSKSQIWHRIMITYMDDWLYLPTRKYCIHIETNLYIYVIYWYMDTVCKKG